MPIGTLTKKIHSHDSVSVRMPPSSRPNARAAGGDRAPDAERLRPVRALLERGRDDRQRGGGDERRAQALQAAGDDQHPARGRQPVQQRREREHDHAGQEDPLAPDQVAGAPAEQQEAAEHQRVAVDHPLQVGGREAEVALDRGQRDVDDRRVEDDHELREADEHEHEPAADLAGRRRASAGRVQRRSWGELLRSRDGYAASAAPAGSRAGRRKCERRGCDRQIHAGRARSRRVALSTLAPARPAARPWECRTARWL